MIEAIAGAAKLVWPVLTTLVLLTQGARGIGGVVSLAAPVLVSQAWSALEDTAGEAIARTAGPTLARTAGQVLAPLAGPIIVRGEGGSFARIEEPAMTRSSSSTGREREAPTGHGVSAAETSSADSGTTSQRSSGGEGSAARDADSDEKESSERRDDDLEDQGPRPSSTPTVSFGEDVEVRQGEYHRDALVCIGGTVTVRGEVHGAIVVIAGVLDISGTARDNVVAVASRVRLGPETRIRGDFVNVAGSLDRSPDARVRGEFHSIGIPNLSRFASGHGLFRFMAALFFWFMVLTTAVRFLAILVVSAVAAPRIEAALALPRPSWVLAFFLGLAVNLFCHLLVFLFCFLFPLGVALWLALHVAIWMGLAAVYLQVGRNASRALFKVQLSYFGSILTGFVLFAIVGVIPIIGWVFGWLVSSTALGLMLLTHFGGRRTGVPLQAAVPPAPGTGMPGEGPLTAATSS